MIKLSQLADEIPKEVDLQDQNEDIEVEERFNKNFKDLLAAEYRSMWADVNIQGDYDRYARSQAPNRSLFKVKSSKKREISFRLNENNPPSTNKESFPKQTRNRIKLSRVSVNAPQIVEDEDNNKPEKTKISAVDIKENTDRKDVILSLGKIKKESKELTTQYQNSNASKQEIDKPFLQNNPRKKYEAKDEKSVILKDSYSRLVDQHEDERKYATKQSKPIKFNKSGKEFMPPVVTAVDFRNPSMEAILAFGTKNGFLIQRNKLQNTYQPKESTVSSLSMLFMASYLENGCHPSGKIIESIVVKAALPPLLLKQKPAIRRHRKIQDKPRECNPNDLQIPEPKATSLIDISDTTKNTNGLPALRESHVYKWRHNPVISQSEKLNVSALQEQVPQTRYRLPRMRKEADTILEQVIRWRSKNRNLSMRKLITSPTKGNQVVRKMLNDKRRKWEIQKSRQAAVYQEAEAGHKTPHPESQNAHHTSVKTYIKEKLQAAHSEGLLDITNMNNVTTS